MNKCQKNLYESILKKLEEKGVKPGEALAKHAPPNKRAWLLENGGTEPRKTIHYAATLTPLEILESFVRKINVTESNSDCWEFSGFCNPYGQTYVCRAIIRTHVLMQSLYHGLPETYGGKESGCYAVRHKCGNRKCCNPAHLENGTIADNIEDIFKSKKREHINGYGSIDKCNACGKEMKRVGNHKKWCSWECYSQYRSERKSLRINKLRAARESALDLILPHILRSDPNHHE